MMVKRDYRQVVTVYTLPAAELRSENRRRMIAAPREQIPGRFRG